jgi:hypothetical protein
MTKVSRKRTGLVRCTRKKTRLIEFGGVAAHNRKKRGLGKPEVFTFLGFTHHCARQRSKGAFIVWRQTAKKRILARLQAIKTELIRRRHGPTPVVGVWLRKVTLGYYQYHAIPGNLKRLQLFRRRLQGLRKCSGTAPLGPRLSSAFIRLPLRKAIQSSPAGW